MNLYRINLNLLVALDTLLQEKNVTQAAKKLSITQAAMSNNLQQLRELFKDPLLLRERNRMALTNYAQELQPKLSHVLDELHNLVSNSQQFDPKESTREFKIAMSDYLASLILPKLLSGMKKQAPNIKISIFPLYHLNSGEIFEQGHYDLGIGKIFETGALIQKQLLFNDHGVVLVHKKNPLAKKQKISLKEYLENKHIAVRSDSSHLPTAIDPALTKLGYQRNIQISLPFIIPIFELLEQSEDLIATIIKSMALLYQSKYSYAIKALPFAIPEVAFYM